MAASLNEKETTSFENKKAGIEREPFGEADGKAVYLFTLRNQRGAEVKITNFGGIVTSWTDADRNGVVSSIVLGFDNLSSYLAGHPFFGALVGRYANRIAHGKFTLDGKEYTLATNKGANHLHGGYKGFDKVVWEAAIVEDPQPLLKLTYLSPDGEEGYPGNLKVTVRYSFHDDNALTIDYEAETDKATPINLTNHSFFNLSGDVTTSILGHAAIIDAAYYTPVDENTLPTGEIKPVAGTPFDFTDFAKPKTIGERIDQTEIGYDHNYVLNPTEGGTRPAAILLDAVSGRKLEMFTDQPGMQFYTGNNLDGTLSSSDGKPIGKRAAVCLETQHFPNSPNEPRFPSTILRPGERFHTVTTYRLSLSVESGTDY